MEATVSCVWCTCRSLSPGATPADTSRRCTVTLTGDGSPAPQSQEFISVNQTKGFTADPILLRSLHPSPESHYVACSNRG